MPSFLKEDFMKGHHHGLRIAVILIFLANFMVANAEDIDPELMKGWEAGSEYNSHYDVREFESIRCWFVRAKEVIPMPGMSPATVIEVLEGADLIEVHLCPTWYRKPSEITLKMRAWRMKGMSLRIRNSSMARLLSCARGWHQAARSGRWPGCGVVVADHKQH